MTAVERFSEVLDVLVADRSPVIRVRELSVQEQRMLVFAQRLRGSRQQGPDPLIVERLGLALAGQAEPAAPMRIRHTAGQTS